MGDTGNGYQRTAILYSLASLALVLSVQAFANKPVPRSTEQDLKPGNGREIVAEHCLVCHDATLITSPQLTRNQWNRIVNEMIEEQGMEAPTPEIRQAVLDYLVETQGPRP